MIIRGNCKSVKLRSSLEEHFKICNLNDGHVYIQITICTNTILRVSS